jgi:cytochrome c553
MLATSGETPVKCGACHGLELRGTAAVPGIAGRTASYLMRQLWDIKQGARKSKAMAPVVAKLDIDDMTAIVAYVASRMP